MKLIKLYSKETVDTLLNRTYSLEYEDGKLTTKGRLKEKKENFQITETTDGAEDLIKDIYGSLLNSPLSAYCHPKKFTNLRIARYTNGGYYDWHVDETFMRGTRTDYSFTIFLVDKDTYNGGELVLKTDVGEVAIKGNAGEVLVYPTTLLHKVNPVTQGDRIVIIGWLESMVKDHFSVDFLFRLRSTIQRLSPLVEGDEEIQGELDRIVADAKRIISK